MCQKYYYARNTTMTKILLISIPPGGNPIPQFNPNTAGVVIIGSVMIGADSSFGLGPFAYVGSSNTSSGLFFLFGTISCHQDSPANKGGALQRDDMSLLSSTMPAVAWWRRGGGGGSTKRGGVEQRDGGSTVAAGRRRFGVCRFVDAYLFDK